jgi:hypothetical protein
MLLGQAIAVRLDFLDRSEMLALRLQGNGRPFRHVPDDDLVAIASIPASVLDFVEDQEFVDRSDQVEVALPGSVVAFGDRERLPEAHDYLSPAPK